MNGAVNPSFVPDEISREENGGDKKDETSIKFTEPVDRGEQRDNWGKGIEFLLSCIALSVGLGKYWQFEPKLCGLID